MGIWEEEPKWKTRVLGEPPNPTALKGQQFRVKFPGDKRTIQTEYMVVEESELWASNDPISFAQRPPEEYPSEIQGRTYDGPLGQHARDEVMIKTAELDPDQLIDTTTSVSYGPPTVTPTGVVIGGNARAMSIQAAYRNNTARAEAYKEALIDRADEFGLDAEYVGQFTDPILVRTLTDEQIDTQDPKVLQELNRASDKPVSKVMDDLSSWESGARKLWQNAELLELISQGMTENDTLLQFLDTAGGRQLWNGMIAQGIVSGEEMGRYTDTTGDLNEAGKDLIAGIIRMAAIGNRREVVSIPKSFLQKLDKSLPFVLSATKSNPEWNLGPLVVRAGMMAQQARVLDAPGSISDKISMIQSESDLTDTPQRRATREAVGQMAKLVMDTKAADLRGIFQRWASSADQDSADQVQLFAPPSMTDQLQALFGIQEMPDLDQALLGQKGAPESMGAEEERATWNSQKMSRPEVTGSMKNIITALRQQTPVFVGRVARRGGKMAEGHFQTPYNTIRLRRADSFSTLAHEIGHLVDWTFQKTVSPLLEGDLDEQIALEAEGLGEDLYGPDEPANGYRSEGFAELIRGLLAGTPDVETKAPNLVRWFREQILAVDEDLALAFREARTAVAKWDAMTPEERGLSQITGVGPLRKRLREWSLRWKNRFVQSAPLRDIKFGVWEEGEALERIEKVLRETAIQKAKAQGKEPPDLDSAFAQLTINRGTATRRVESAVKYGVSRLGSTQKISYSLENAFGLIRKAEEADFSVYLLALQTLEWRRRDTRKMAEAAAPGARPAKVERLESKSGLSFQDAESILAALDAFPDNRGARFEKAAARIAEWNEAMVRRAGQASPSFNNTAKKILEEGIYYVPLFRDFMGEVVPGGGTSGQQGAQFLVRMKGSQRPIQDLRVNLIQNAVRIERATQREQVINTLFKLIQTYPDNLGHIISPVDKDYVLALPGQAEELIRDPQRATRGTGDRSRSNPGRRREAG